jgi:hypothetical protein
MVHLMRQRDGARPPAHPATDPAFGAVLNCLDGRAHPPVTAWLHRERGMRFLDRVTEPGADGILAAGDDARIAALREQVTLSVRAHAATLVAVVGHHDCAANPGPREQHLAQIQ